MIEFLRLAFGTLLVLLPGRLVARALGQRSASATLVWALASSFVAWAVVFLVHGTIWLAIGILGGICVVAGLGPPPGAGVLGAPGRAGCRPAPRRDPRRAPLARRRAGRR